MKVSVLVPAYNCEKWVGGCIESIVNQSYKDIELILYNDGSDDDTLPICKRYAETDSRIRIISESHMGIGYARNRLVQSAVGDAILFVDADDWIELDMIAVMAQKFIDDKLDICSCNAVMHTTLSISTLYAAKGDYCIISRDRMVKDYIELKPLHGSLCNKLMSATIAKKIQFDCESAYAEDSDFMWNLIQIVNRGGIVPVAFYHYCRHEGSLSDWKFNDSKLDHVYLWTRILKEVNLSYPQYLSKARRSFAGLLTSYLYSIAISNYDDKGIISQLRRWLRQHISQYYIFTTNRFLHVAFALVCILSWPMTKKISMSLEKVLRKHKI